MSERFLKFVTRSNWVLFVLAVLFGFLVMPFDFARGILFGGLIVTINFHLLYKTLKNAFTPPNISSHGIVLLKYYIRFVVSGIIIFILIFKDYVDPIGLIVGLSVVVGSIMITMLLEIKKILFKEAT